MDVSKVLEALNVLLVALGPNSINTIVMRILNDDEFVNKIIRTLLSTDETPSQHHARAIMGSGFVSIEEAAQCFGISPTSKDLRYLNEIPFGDKVLETCKDTHLLIPVLPIPIVSMVSYLRKHRSSQIKLSASINDSSAYSKFKNRGRARWVLLSKQLYENSLTHNWRFRNEKLSEYGGMVEAQVVMYAVVVHYLRTGEKLFINARAHCKQCTSNGMLPYLCWQDDELTLTNLKWFEYVGSVVGIRTQ